MKQTFIALSIIAALASCGEKDIDIPLPPPSSGSTMQLEGGNGGAAAENSVYVDFSADKQTSVLRDSWDLGFYCGSDFKVVINSFNGASAVQVNKTDINSVTKDDIKIDTLKVGLLILSQTEYKLYGSFNVIDDPRESIILNKTAIESVSATDSENKVYVLNRKGGDATADDANLYKIRVLRKGTGYTLQYAKLSETTFKTLDINKNTNYSFQFASVVSGSVVNVEPAKKDWDFVWSWSMNFVSQGGYAYPYAFSDMVFINTLDGVQAKQMVYYKTATEDSTEVASAAFVAFNKDSVAKYTLSSNRDVIGSNWRNTTGSAVGVKKDRFYLVKDAGGNYYKLKFISMGAGTPPLDGGTRGKPEIKYELIK